MRDLGRMSQHNAVVTYILGLLQFSELKNSFQHIHILGYVKWRAFIRAVTIE